MKNYEDAGDKKTKRANMKQFNMEDKLMISGSCLAINSAENIFLRGLSFIKLKFWKRSII